MWGALGERRSEFSSPTLDRLGVQAGHVRDQLVTTMAQTVGLDRGIPPPLLFIQAGQQQVHLVVQGLIRMGSFLLAMRTLAPMDFGTRHGTLQCVRGG
jgi:hypothetical protein